MWRNLLVITLSVSVVSMALADIPLPKDLKYVDPRVRFDGIEKHAGHVF